VLGGRIEEGNDVAIRSLKSANILQSRAFMLSLF